MSSDSQIWRDHLVESVSEAKLAGQGQALSRREGLKVGKVGRTILKKSLPRYPGPRGVRQWCQPTPHQEHERRIWTDGQITTARSSANSSSSMMFEVPTGTGKSCLLLPSISCSSTIGPSAAAPVYPHEIAQDFTHWRSRRGKTRRKRNLGLLPGANIPPLGKDWRGQRQGSL